MLRGKKYRVVYRDPSQRRDRMFVGLYLGLQQEAHVFSLRPAAGTSTMPTDWLIESTLVPDTMPCRVPFMVRKGIA